MLSIISRQNVDSCLFLLLSRDGAVGLDLSFVTHIFFLDELFDEVSIEL